MYIAVPGKAMPHNTPLVRLKRTLHQILHNLTVSYAMLQTISKDSTILSTLASKSTEWRYTNRKSQTQPPCDMFVPECTLK